MLLDQARHTLTPQNSSTELKVMISLSKSFQLSPYTPLVQLFLYIVGVCYTFPLGGLVNQRVHLCINGCLTLKFSWL